MRRTAALAMVGMFVCGSAAAGPLSNDPNAWKGWCGSVDVASVQGDLQATIDYAVYWWSEYSGLNYVPPEGEFVYAYQLYATGEIDSEVVKFKVTMIPSNEANSIDDDTTLGQAGGHVPVDAGILEGDQAYWEWTESDNPLATHSDGLVFSSVNAPWMFLGTVVNHGQYAEGSVPSPSDEIPEPATLGLLAAGFFAALRRRRR